MKKFIKIFTSVLLLSACSEHDVLIENEDSQSEKAVQSEIRTIDEAYDIAAKAISWIGDGESRTSVRLLPSKRDIKVVMNNKSRSGESSDTLMYVVNFEDEQGFAIIPANRIMPELLAVTENGSYDPETGSEVEPFQEYMDNAMEILEGSSVLALPRDTLRDVLTEQKEEVTIDTLFIVSPKTPYLWGQRGICGKYCSNGICGCSNLAAAMIMAYHKYPTSITLTHHNDSVITLNWDNIRLHNSRNTYFSGYHVENVPHEDQDALGRLCRESGKRAYSYYDSTLGTTSTYMVDLRLAVASFGLVVSSVNEYTEGSEISVFNNGGIMCVRGSDSVAGGHCWVLDGYLREEVTTTKYIRENDPNMLQPGPWQFVSEGKSTFNYSHHNWGWKGECNGWFLVGVWSTGSPHYYDNNFNNNYTYNFSIEKKYFSVNRP